jgi:hypothetical protein
VFGTAHCRPQGGADKQRRGKHAPWGATDKDKSVATIFSPASTANICQVKRPCIASSITSYPAPITCGAPRTAIKPISRPASAG